MSKMQWAHGFYRLTPEQRRQILADRYQLSGRNKNYLNNIQVI